MYINFHSFQHFRKHQFWEREHGNRGNGTWTGTEMSTLQGFSLTLATAFIDTTTLQNWVSSSSDSPKSPTPVTCK